MFAVPSFPPAFLVALVLAIALSTPGIASAGEYTVASCQADSANFSTVAFADFATRGMNIRRACNPEGPGARGLVTGNTVRAAAVPRGSVAMATINAPAGTTFRSFRWAGSIRRGDCRFALQIYAEVPNGQPVSVKNVRANQGCAKSKSGQAAGYRSRAYDITGATRIVQRIVCMGGGGRKSCSGRQVNYVRTYKAVVSVIDTQAPTATILGDTPLAAGTWVAGTQPLGYDGQDNVGVRAATLSASDASIGSDQRPCAIATPDGAFANATPCPNGPGRIEVKTNRLAEGTQQLAVQVMDTAGNVGASAPVTAHIDNTAPASVSVDVDRGDGWRNTNDFTAKWTNPVEADRAPIVGATYKLCAADNANCSQTDVTGDGLETASVPVPGPGEWTVSLWRRDAAGNSDSAAASVPVTLRYDPEAPQLSFDAPGQSDPTLLSVPVVDKVSGLASGVVEISPAGSDTWQTLKTEVEGSRLIARVDDANLPSGQYAMRATAQDRAGNQASTTQRSDGQPMTMTLPARIASAIAAGVPHVKTVRQVVRKNGRRRVTRRRVTELRRSGIVRLGERTQIAGQLANRDGQGITGAEVQVLETSSAAAEHLVGTVTTDSAGKFTYTATGTTTRTLRFAYGGSPIVLPADAKVDLKTPAESTLRVDRSRVVNGQSVTFSGRVATAPIPAGGKLVQVEVALSGRWQTFRTVRTDATGAWSLPYRFARTRGITWYRFRVELPPEAGYPFAAGISRSIRVRVRGR